MTHTFVFLLLAWLQPPPEGAVLRSGCSAEDRQMGPVGVEDQVEVQQALAGGSQTCYRVTVQRAGQDVTQTVTGYLLGETHPAIAAFIHRRQEVGASSLEAQARSLAAPPPPPKAASSDKPAAPLPENLPVFESFSGRDQNGKSVSLDGIRSRVTLVTFWSPNSPASVGNLLSVATVFKHFSRSDLSAVGISADPNLRHVENALDDTMPGWPLISDPGGLAKRYNADLRAGTTFVLDASHRIVGTGLSGAALEAKIRELLSTH